MSFTYIKDINLYILSFCNDTNLIILKRLNKESKNLINNNFNLNKIIDIKDLFLSVELIKEYINYLSKRNCLTSAIRYNASIEVLTFLHNSNFKANGSTFDEAIRQQNITNILWLKTKGYNWGPWTTLYAAKTCNLEILKWLIDDGCSFNGMTFEAVANIGNLNIMKWLKENNCPWDASTFSYACGNGNLQNMIWLKENDCPYDEYAFHFAVRLGNIENLIWLKENEFPWNETTSAWAIEAGNSDVIMWLKDNGCP
jgi:hypothetical protein